MKEYLVLVRKIQNKKPFSYWREFDDYSEARAFGRRKKEEGAVSVFVVAVRTYRDLGSES